MNLYKASNLHIHDKLPSLPSPRYVIKLWNILNFLFFIFEDELDRLLNDILAPPGEEEQLLNGLVNDNEDDGDGLNVKTKKGVNEKYYVCFLLLFLHHALIL